MSQSTPSTSQSANLGAFEGAHSRAHVVLIGGSPSADSRSQRVLLNLQQRLTEQSALTQAFAARDFPAAALLSGNTNEPVIQQFVETLKHAAAIVFGTPVYKATYTGVLKALIDVIPPDALIGKAALAVATARQPAHFASTLRAFEDLFAFFRVGRVLPPLFLLDEQVRVDAGALQLGDSAAQSLSTSAHQLASLARAELSPKSSARG